MVIWAGDLSVSAGVTASTIPVSRVPLGQSFWPCTFTSDRTAAWMVSPGWACCVLMAVFSSALIVVPAGAWASAIPAAATTNASDRNNFMRPLTTGSFDYLALIHHGGQVGNGMNVLKGLPDMATKSPSLPTA